jgi:hypothetical protein
MHLTSFIVAVAVAFRVAHADFMVYTVPPIPTAEIPTFTDPAEVSLTDTINPQYPLTSRRLQAGPSVSS